MQSIKAVLKDKPELTRLLSTRRQAKKRMPNGHPFLGAEDEIRTRATVSHTTPLAGEPLEPLGYFCKAQSYITISHFFVLVKAFSRKKMKSS